MDSWIASSRRLPKMFGDPCQNSLALERGTAKGERTKGHFYTTFKRTRKDVDGKLQRLQSIVERDREVQKRGLEKALTKGVFSEERPNLVAILAKLC